MVIEFALHPRCIAKMGGGLRMLSVRRENFARQLGNKIFSVDRMLCASKCVTCTEIGGSSAI